MYLTTVIVVKATADARFSYSVETVIVNLVCHYSPSNACNIPLKIGRFNIWWAIKVLETSQ